MSKLDLPKDHPYTAGRTCTTCGEFKEADLFYIEKCSRSVGGVAMRSKCKVCDEVRKWKGDLKRKYGITYKEYCIMLDTQQGTCAICNSPDSQSSRTSGQLFVDHCHTTNKVRGLLCSKCNHALGQFNDNVDLLKTAINYLSK